AATGALLGSLTVPGNWNPYVLLPDEAHHRIFVWTQLRSRDVLLSYDLDTLQLLGVARVYDDTALQPGFVKSMALWGSEGIALTDGVQLSVMSGSLFWTYRGGPGSPTQ